MKVFVTGATGFVGQAVVEALRRRDHEVVGLVREARKGKALEQLGVTLAAGDMLKPATYEGIVQTVDMVINTAQYGIQGRLTGKKLKQIEQAYPALRSLELVAFFHSHPRHPAPLRGQRVMKAHCGLFLH